MLRCYPDDTLIMRITHMDAKIGAVRAESVNEVARS